MIPTVTSRALWATSQAALTLQTAVCTCRIAAPRFNAQNLTAGQQRGIHLTAPLRSPAPPTSSHLPQPSSSNIPHPSTPPGSSKRRRFGAVGAGILAIGTATWYWATQEDPRLSEQKFVPLKITGVEKVNADTSIFKLALPKALLPKEMYGGPILSLYVMQPDLQIQRPYTPLSFAPFASDGSTEVELLVKRYDTGELSRWMHRLQVGDEVKVRGPVVTWDYRPDAVDDVVFIVGGTGITPAYQLLETVLAKPNPPNISIIYASSSPSNIYLQTPMNAFSAQHPDKLSVTYVVDKLDPGMKETACGPIVGRLNTKIVGDVIGRGGGSGRRVVVVCGPDGMVAHVAGPRARNLSQGPVGGILGELGYTSQEVIKL
ncbi:cytochrome-b5 reductase, partial [Phenoliferia sp. Uapishka_3]